MGTTLATSNGTAKSVEEILVHPQTKHPKIWRDLAAPFDARDVKALSKGGKRFSYVTARTVMNRLDYAVGPENWWDRYIPGEHSVICELTIRLPDESTVTKCDAGAYAGMSDPGDDDKSGFSDALKRAAARFGVARYLYGDGVPDYGSPPTQPDNGTVEPGPAASIPSPSRRRTAAPDRTYSEPIRPVSDLRRWLNDEVTKTNDSWACTCAIERVDPGKPITIYQVSNALITQWLDEGAIEHEDVETDGKRDKEKAAIVLKEAWGQHRGDFKEDVAAYLRGKVRELAKAAGIELAEEPDGDPVDIDEWEPGRE